MDQVAVCGIGLRMPSAHDIIDSPSKFWDLISLNLEALVKPTDKWKVEKYYDSIERKGKCIVEKACLVAENNLLEFDPAYFSISPNDARHMDPQQRSLLVCTTEALLDAQIKPEDVKGKLVDVVIGEMTNDYQDLIRKDPACKAGPTVLGNARALSSNRISFFFGFQGRSLTVDTACSSSLLAVDLCYENLISRKADYALAGGVNYIHNPETFISFADLGILSPDGRCKWADELADGYGRGEAVCTVILRRLSDAIKDGNTIYASIIASGSNHDGPKDFLSFPSQHSQTKLIDAVYKRSFLDPDDTQYFECHGTGTIAGDSTELKAVVNAMKTQSRNEDLKGKLIVNSSKPLVGHGEGAAGITSFVKTILCIYFGKIPGRHPSLKTLSKKIDLEYMRLEILTSGLHPWPNSNTNLKGFRRASVNSFGIGGANTHIVLSSVANINTNIGLNRNSRLLKKQNDSIKILHENWKKILNVNKKDKTILSEKEAKKNTTNNKKISSIFSKFKKETNEELIILPLSTHTRTTLKELAKRTSQLLKENLRKPKQQYDIISNIYCLPTCAFRTLLVAHSINQDKKSDSTTFKFNKKNTSNHLPSDEQKTFDKEYDTPNISSSLQAKQSSNHSLSLIELLDSISESNVVDLKPASSSLPLLFIFPGQGWQFPHMCLPLMTFPYFNNCMEKCQSIIHSFDSSIHLLEEISLPNIKSRLITSACIGQVVNSAVQLSLCHLLKYMFGITPIACLGHSSGEMVSACVSNRITMYDALRIAYIRGKYIDMTNHGGMVVIGTSLSNVEKLISEYSSLQIACINSDNSVTVCGTNDDCNHLIYILKKEQLLFKKLPQPFAYHHPSIMKDASENFLTELTKKSDLSLKSGKIKKQDHFRDITFYSSVYGRQISGRNLNAAYWKKSIVSPVLFSSSLKECISKRKIAGIIEISPRSVLESIILQHLEGEVKIDPICPFSRDNSIESMYQTLGILWKRGAHLRFLSPKRNSIHPLFDNCIRYPFEFKKMDAFYGITSLFLKGITPHNLLGEIKPFASNILCWENVVDIETDFFIRDHIISDSCLFPASGYIEMAITAAHQAAKSEKILQSNENYNIATSPVILRNLFFNSPLFLQTNTFSVLHSTYEPDTAFFKVTALHFSEKPDNNLPPTTIHFTCYAEVMPYSPKLPKVPEFDSQISQSIPSDIFYSKLHRLGYSYGETMKRMKNIKLFGQKDNLQLSISTSLINKNPKPSRFLYNANPSFIDSAIQSFLCVAFPELPFLYVPYRMKTLIWDPLTIHNKNLDHILENIESNSSNSMTYSEVLNKKISTEMNKEEISKEDQLTNVVYSKDENDLLPFEAISAIISPPDTHSNSTTCNVWVSDQIKIKKRKNDVSNLNDNEIAIKKIPFLTFIELEARPFMIPKQKTNDTYLYTYDNLDHFIPDTLDINNKNRIIVNDIVSLCLNVKNLQNLFEFSHSDNSFTENSFCIYSLVCDCSDNECRLNYNVVDKSIINKDIIEHFVLTISKWIDLFAKKSFNLVLYLDSTNASSVVLSGIAKTISNENNLFCRVIPSTMLLDKTLLLHFMNDDIRFIDYTDTRILRHCTLKESTFNLDYDIQNWSLFQSEEGNIDSFMWKPSKFPIISDPRNVIIQVSHVGINFKDIVVGLRLLESGESRSVFNSGWSQKSLGTEVSGIVVKAGSESEFKKGDNVFGIPLQGDTGFQQYLELHYALITIIPQSISFAAASTLRVAVMTASICLYKLAKIKRGDKILIHSGAGGVGSLAVQMAKKAGCIVITTASTFQKQEFCRKILKADHVFSSRNMDFLPEILSLYPQGVDVVLNSMHGVVSRSSFRILAPFGRFIDIGKRDVADSKNIKIESLLENIIYFFFDLDRVVEWAVKVKNGYNKNEIFHQFDHESKKMNSEPEDNLFLDITSQLENIHEYIWNVTEYSSVSDGFKALMNAKVIGKVAIDIKKAITLCCKPSHTAFSISSPFQHKQVDKNKIYIVTGGTRGVGLFLAEILIERHGVSNIMLIGSKSVEKENLYMKKFRDRHRDIDIQIISCDLRNFKRFKKIISNLHLPLGGILHSAGIINDASFSDLSKEFESKFWPVIDIKAKSANYLASLCRDRRAWLISISSLSAVIGNQHQSPYVGANLYLEQCSTKILAIGPVADIGMASRDIKLLSGLNAMGIKLVTPLQVADAFSLLFNSDLNYILCAHVNWSSMAAFSSFRVDFDINIIVEVSDNAFFQEIRQTSSEIEAKDLISNLIAGKIAEVTDTSVENIRFDVPFTTFGLDSLSLVVLKNWIDKTLGISMPFFEFSPGSTILSMTDTLLIKVVEYSIKNKQQLPEWTANIQLDVKKEEEEDTSFSSKEEEKRLITLIRSVELPNLLLFCIPGFNSNNFSFTFCKDFNEDNFSQCYLINSYTSSSHEDKWNSYLNNVTESVIKEVKNVRNTLQDTPNTLPFALIGHSFGALIAFAVARELELQNFSPLHIGIIHAVSPHEMIQHRKEMKKIKKINGQEIVEMLPVDGYEREKVKKVMNIQLEEVNSQMALIKSFMSNVDTKKAAKMELKRIVNIPLYIYCSKYDELGINKQSALLWKHMTSNICTILEDSQKHSAIVNSPSQHSLLLLEKVTRIDRNTDVQNSNLDYFYLVEWIKHFPNDWKARRMLKYISDKLSLSSIKLNNEKSSIKIKSEIFKLTQLVVECRELILKTQIPVLFIWDSVLSHFKNFSIDVGPVITCGASLNEILWICIGSNISDYHGISVDRSLVTDKLIENYCIAYNVNNIYFVSEDVDLSLIFSRMSSHYTVTNLLQKS